MIIRNNVLVVPDENILNKLKNSTNDIEFSKLSSICPINNFILYNKKEYENYIQSLSKINFENLNNYNKKFKIGDQIKIFSKESNERLNFYKNLKPLLLDFIKIKKSNVINNLDTILVLNDDDYELIKDFKLSKKYIIKINEISDDDSLFSLFLKNNYIECILFNNITNKKKIKLLYKNIYYSYIYVERKFRNISNKNNEITNDLTIYWDNQRSFVSKNVFSLFEKINKTKNNIRIISSSFFHKRINNYKENVKLDEINKLFNIYVNNKNLFSNIMNARYDNINFTNIENKLLILLLMIKCKKYNPRLSGLDLYNIQFKEISKAITINPKILIKSLNEIFIKYERDEISKVNFNIKEIFINLLKTEITKKINSTIMIEDFNDILDIDLKLFFDYSFTDKQLSIKKLKLIDFFRIKNKRKYSLYDSSKN